jgi:DNA-directed RNA polymerase subunit RPC12/RpoP
MKKNDVTCSACGAGFRRLELATPPANQGEYRCPACDEVLETFDGSAYIAYRMTIQPSMKAARQ